MSKMICNAIVEFTFNYNNIEKILYLTYIFYLKKIYMNFLLKK